MNCPLCGKLLKQHLLQPDLAIISCTDETCIYPFNMTMEELQSANLIFEVNSQDIMFNMKDKLVNANVDTKLADFISKEDKEIE